MKALKMLVCYDQLFDEMFITLEFNVNGHKYTPFMNRDHLKVKVLGYL